MAPLKMELLLCWITLRMCQPQNSSLRHGRISFQLDDRTSISGQTGPVFSPVSKVKCTLICFERTSCTSVFYWKSEGKCEINIAQQAPAEQGGHANAPRRDPKNAKKQDLNSEITIRERGQKGKVYYGVLKNIFHSKVWVYFKEIDLGLIYYNDKKYFPDAEAVCNNLEGDTSLFQVDSQKKQDIAVRLVERSDQEKIFIGVYYDMFPGEWKYMDRSSVTYTNWAPGKQQFKQFGRFVMLVKKNGYKWKTSSFKEKTGWICQKKTQN